MGRKQTPSQTIGPYFAYGLTPRQYGYPFSAIAGADMVPEGLEDGERIRVQGRVLDGQDTPVNDAMVEFWQADAFGRYAHPADPQASNTPFGGFGRCGTGTDPESRFIVDTIKPGAASDGSAPHINVTLFARGLLVHLFTRIYFADEQDANARDTLLLAVPEERRQTLVAPRRETDKGTVYDFDIRLQGPAETVFFDF
jgi:protocatechuate 3,4-dioxygenase alpha subunit